MEELRIAGKTEILIGRGLPDTLLPERADRERAAILTQPGATHQALEIADRLRTDLAVEVLGLPDREQAKTLEVAASVYEALSKFGLARHDTIVGVGGGSVTDLSGFVAATWLRGVEAVQYPTTLLGAVDAAIGGKTGVNLAGKNLVGVIWHPTRVVVDLVALESLPSSLLREGMAEVLKAGLLGDGELFELLEQKGMDASLRDVVSRAIAVKARVVDADEREHGARALLNLGHTIGHAIEFASPLSHGESVGIGMVAAARISESRLGFGEAARVEAAIGGLGLPIRVKGLDRARVEDLLRLDKKRDAGGIRMILLEAIGAPVLQHVDAGEIDLGLSAVGL